MFGKKTKTKQLIDNTKQIKHNVKGLEYIKDVLNNVYDISTYNTEIDTLIDDIKYVNPSIAEEASVCHKRIESFIEDIKRLFQKYSLELNEYDFKKILKKVKLQVYERKQIS